jgi:hypothetical protein
VKTARETYNAGVDALDDTAGEAVSSATSGAADTAQQAVGGVVSVGEGVTSGRSLRFHLPMFYSHESYGSGS